METPKVTNSVEILGRVACAHVQPARVKSLAAAPLLAEIPRAILLRHNPLLRWSLQGHIIRPGVQQSLRGRVLSVAVGPITCRSMGIHVQRVELQQA